MSCDQQQFQSYKSLFCVGILLVTDAVVRCSADVPAVGEILEACSITSRQFACQSIYETSSEPLNQEKPL